MERQLLGSFDNESGVVMIADPGSLDDEQLDGIHHWMENPDARNAVREGRFGIIVGRPGISLGGDVDEDDTGITGIRVFGEYQERQLQRIIVEIEIK